MTKWQPIETAPRDGTSIIICLDVAAPVPAFDNDVMSRVVLGDFTHKGNLLVGPYGERRLATHWMPLPEPPKPP